VGPEPLEPPFPELLGEDVAVAVEVGVSVVTGVAVCPTAGVGAEWALVEQPERARSPSTPSRVIMTASGLCP
jgi:hypothetical protein